MNLLDYSAVAVPAGFMASGLPFGAHLSGMPLNKQLTERHARLVSKTQTSADYRFYALPGGPPWRPGLVQVEKDSGYAIEVEVWEMAATLFGSFVAGIPAPLCIGTVTLESGQRVQGFLCEQYAVANAKDISELGGWRAYMDGLR